MSKSRSHTDALEDWATAKAEYMAAELVEKWENGYDDSTNMRSLLRRYLEHALFEGYLKGVAGELDEMP